MSTAKEEVRQVIDQQPDDSSYEELVRELPFSVMVRRGLKDSDKGRIISQEAPTEEETDRRDAPCNGMWPNIC